jgi:hypothetical protein
MLHSCYFGWGNNIVTPIQPPSPCTGHLRLSFRENVSTGIALGKLGHLYPAKYIRHSSSVNCRVIRWHASPSNSDGSVVNTRTGPELSVSVTRWRRPESNATRVLSLSNRKSGKADRRLKVRTHEQFPLPAAGRWDERGSCSLRCVSLTTLHLEPE